jgi:hypothetical protein
MNIFLSIVAAFGVGFIGLLLQIHKEDKAEIEASHNLIRTLRARHTPWNKGKSGYKQPRKKKYVEYKNFSELAASEEQTRQLIESAL